MSNSNNESITIIIYAIPGSQYTFKVLAALQARKIPHYVEFVPVDTKQRRKVLPSGGTMVPEMKVLAENNADTMIVVTDSEAILHWIDEHYYQANLFPNKLASDLSVRASTKVLAGAVWYYNWVNQAGYEASMQKSIAIMLFPKWIQWILGGGGGGGSFLQNWIVDWLVADQRTKHSHLAMQAMDIHDEAILKDEQHMYNILQQELEYFQSFLKKPSQEQPYLLEDTSEPTAADFSVYAQLERLVGAGTASDITVFPSLQQLKDNETTFKKFQRLWEWHNGMRERLPVQFKGKRLPKQ